MRILWRSLVCALALSGSASFALAQNSPPPMFDVSPLPALPVSASASAVDYDYFAGGKPDETLVLQSPTCEAMGPAPACSNGVMDDCCCCRPCWTVRAEALIWQRSGIDERLLIDSPTNWVAAEELDNDWAAGPRITVQRANIFNSCWDGEVVFFGINGWFSTGTVLGATTFATTPPYNFAPSDTFIDLSSNLYSTEVNARRSINDRLTFLAGFRWVEMGEELATFISAPNSSHVVNVNNHLYGGQLGLDWRLWDSGNRAFVNVVGKAGVFYNAADQTTDIFNIPGAVTFASASDNTTAFVGELGMYGGYALTDNWRLIAGYSLIWLSGVADAPSQLDTTNITTGVATLDTGATPLYHGATVGFEYVR